MSWMMSCCGVAFFGASKKGQKANNTKSGGSGARCDAEADPSLTLTPSPRGATGQRACCDLQWARNAPRRAAVLFPVSLRILQARVVLLGLVSRTWYTLCCKPCTTGPRVAQYPFLARKFAGSRKVPCFQYVGVPVLRRSLVLVGFSRKTTSETTFLGVPSQKNNPYGSGQNLKHDQGSRSTCMILRSAKQTYHCERANRCHVSSSHNAIPWLLLKGEA